MTRPSPRKVGKALPLRVVRAALKADRDRLIRLVVDYTKKERANVDVGEPEMVKAWLALNAAAEAAGKLPISPHVWEVALEDGSVAAIVPDNDHAHAVVAEGRQVAVYTLDEIARFLSIYPAIAKAKLTFPGSTVTAVRRSVDDPLLAIHDTQADLNDPVPDLS